MFFRANFNDVGPLYLDRWFCASARWRCWLGYVAFKNRPEMIRRVYGGTLNPIHTELTVTPVLKDDYWAYVSRRRENKPAACPA